MSDEQMQITEAELRAMTAEMVEMHEATFPEMRDSLSDLGSALREDERGAARSAERRRFLIGGGALAAGSLLLATTGGRAAAATLGEGGSAVPTGSGRGTSAADALTSSANKDVAALKLDASLENLAVFAYGAALKDAGKGKFGKVPAAVAEFAKHAMHQHADHAQAFNAALVNAGSKAYTKPDPALTPAVLKMYKATNSVPGLAKLALTLENTAAATYIKQMKSLRTLEALNAVATIAPVERQHAAILSFVLGDYPVPDTFVKLGPTSTSLGARPTSDLK
ncbi:MAG TPA: ferritin-like domain-containing protein [Sporichthya sp.]|nr:ferritin-like domain-containing protein [Sporichthya sp.]